MGVAAVWRRSSAAPTNALGRCLGRRWLPPAPPLRRSKEEGREREGREERKEGRGKEERRRRAGGTELPAVFLLRRAGVWVWGCAAMSQLRRIPTPVGRLYAANLDAARGPLPTEVMLVINLTKRDTPGPVTRRR